MRQGFLKLIGAAQFVVEKNFNSTAIFTILELVEPPGILVISSAPALCVCRRWQFFVRAKRAVCLCRDGRCLRLWPYCVGSCVVLSWLLHVLAVSGQAGLVLGSMDAP